MSTLKVLFSSLVIVGSLAALAGPDLSAPPIQVDPSLVQTGQLFSIKIIPGAKQTKFYVVGTEAASIDLKNMTVEALLLAQGQKRKIQLKKVDDHYVTTDKVEGQVQLKIRAGSESKEESFKVDIKAKP